MTDFDSWKNYIHNKQLIDFCEKHKNSIIQDYRTAAESKNQADALRILAKAKGKEDILTAILSGEWFS